MLQLSNREYAETWALLLTSLLASGSINNYKLEKWLQGTQLQVEL